MTTQDICLFSLERDNNLAKNVAELLGMSLHPVELRVFPDTEIKIRSLASVRRQHCILVGSIKSDDKMSANDALCQHIFLIGSLLDAGAAQVSSVVPYLAYTRKDRRTKSRDPVTIRYVAQLLEAIGLSRMIVIDAHSETALQNAFRIPTESLQSISAIVSHLATNVADDSVLVLSPDIGGIQRASKFLKCLSKITSKKISFGFLEKWRSQDEISGGAVVAEDMRGKTVIIVDDIISTGTTVSRTAKICKDRGAKKVIVAATHGLFSRESEDVLIDPAIERIIVTNSVTTPAFRSAALQDKVEVIDLSPLITHTIQAISTQGSINQKQIF